ncbi:glycosyltransferase family protein [Aquiflexum lacus]|uniref:hypothetical protein n=1 Tax=Aquiflexum lacus TaxID=2483805 RepID=UPI001895DDE5|nr:hypothetical protein [Aquiflexum lacus]
MIQQTKIAIASVLKPLKDPRAYYRFGLSLRETNKYQINIIGFSTKNVPNEKNIKFSPLFCKIRNHYSRLFVNLKLLTLLFKDKPKVLIVTTFELLPAGVLTKLLLKTKLIYDLQENHVLNIQENKTSSGFKKSFSRILVNFFEFCSNPFIDHYFFAEACYKKEFPQLYPYTVLENRFFGKNSPIPTSKVVENHQYKFLISGTLTKVYGILEGIQWFQMINEQNPGTTLHIIGHATLPDYKSQIAYITKGHPTITCEISDYPVPYEAILKAYQQADFILMPYFQIPSIQPKIPSKLYESFALLKPCLFSSNPKWKSLSDPYPGGMEVDFKDLANAQENFQSFLKQKHYLKLPGQEVLWKSQEEEFLKVISRLVSV